MDVAILIIIGLGMGVIGGMLGIGGAVFLIPALTFTLGENQHLYQAAAMICIFFVSGSALIAHRKAKAISKEVLIRLIPAAMLGIVGGVALSNCSFFEGDRDYLLARLFGGFLVYVAFYNALRLYRSMKQHRNLERDEPLQRPKTVPAALCGLATGLASGLLGIGAGTVSTPLQQFSLKRPLREAMSNSAAAIVSISWLGAIYKNATLAQHGIGVTESLRIAVCIIPGAIIGGYIGGHLMHALPKNIVRAVFIAVCIIAAVKLLTVSPS
ncbi:MAG: hypothetical protein B6I25_01505 [Planctomycetales bacterium 4572_13]|nr:MAG: hypothetical protein B6I25_01505 [Planctomycetales bacterium 4572_13]